MNLFFILLVINSLSGFNFEINETDTNKYVISNNENVDYVYDENELDTISSEDKFRVVFKFNDSFNCCHTNFEDFDDVIEHRKELKEYYETYNQEIYNSLPFTGYSDISISKLGPYISIQYDTKNDFINTDYSYLKKLQISNLKQVFFENYVEQDENNYSTADSSLGSYSFSKALSDIGVFPDMPFNGQGINIGFMEEGIPNSSINYNLNSNNCYGTTTSLHAYETSSIAGGTSGIAPGANMFFSSTTDNGVFDSLDWLIFDKSVNVINYSAGFDNSYSGKYSFKTDYFDYLVKETKVSIVVAVGNINKVSNVSQPATALNVISVSSCDKDLKKAYHASTGVYDEYDNIIKKPTLLAPGDDLYGIPHVSDSLSGTSYATPMVTGIVALLMQEYPYLKSHPELVISLLSNSCEFANGQTQIWDNLNGFGIINYQNARKVYSQSMHGSITSLSGTNSVLYSQDVTIPKGSTLKVTGNVLFNSVNGVIGSNTFETGETIDASDIVYSNLKLQLINSNYDVVAENESIGNLNYLSYVNTNNSTAYLIRVVLDGTKTTGDMEYYGFNYSIDSNKYLAVVNLTENNYLDEYPTFEWEILNNPYNLVSANYKLCFLDCSGEVIFEKVFDTSINSYTLSEEEWRAIIELDNRDYYVYLKYYSSTNSNVCYFSEMYCGTEPRDYNNKVQIKPADWGFDARYYFESEGIKTTMMQIDNLTITTSRLRCGYIENQYINLSPYREDAGEAYFEMIFNQPIYSFMYGITMWSLSEKIYSGDVTAHLLVKDWATDEWIEVKDLVNDILLPTSRTSVDRYIESFPNGIDGIKFYMTSPATGDRNKGRICIDDIVLSLDPNDTDFISGNYEAII